MMPNMWPRPGKRHCHTEGGASESPAGGEFGDSDALAVGDPVYAIGNPLRLELRGTFTDGIVSAINRNVTVNGKTMNLIQTMPP